MFTAKTISKWIVFQFVQLYLRSRNWFNRNVDAFFDNFQL